MMETQIRLLNANTKDKSQDKSQDKNKQLLAQSKDGVWLAKEGMTIHVEVPASRDQDVSALVAGAELQLHSSKSAGGGQKRVVFVLLVHTWAGFVQIYVLRDGEPTLLLLDVQPHPEKFGATTLRELIAELMEYGAGLPFGLSPGQQNLAAGSGGPNILHPFIIEVLLPPLLKALQRLRREQLRRLIRVREVTPLTSAQGVDAQTLRWLAVHPASYANLRPRQGGAQLWGTQAGIELSKIKSTSNHAANRYLVFLLKALLRALGNTLGELRRVEGGSGEGHRDPGAQAYAKLLCDPIQRGMVSIRRTLESEPLRGLKAQRATEGALQAVIDHPLYAQIQRLVRQMIDPGATLDAVPELRVSLRPTYDLFEFLVLFRVADALRAIAGDEWSWKMEALESTGLLLKPPKSTKVPFVSGRGPGKRTIELHFQRQFGSIHQTSGIYESISRQRIPDYLIVEREEGALKRWWLLDAKFRASRSPVHDGLADMHVYRDALRLEGTRASGGYVILPVIKEEVKIFAEAQYLEEHCFGVVGGESGDLRAFLEKLLLEKNVGSETSLFQENPLKSDLPQSKFRQTALG